MADALRHRGPDGEGYASSGPGSSEIVHLGHRRLAVIDPEGGAQPKRTSCGRWLITFNGEIYNFMELRARLAAEGVSFQSRSDTEVLLHAVARWGEAALRELDGMFAFAAFDRVASRLLLAVDRFGQKPLVWTIVPGGWLVFASELSALRRHPDVGREWDTLAMCRMLAFGAPPAPQTVLRGVSRLEPGTLLALTVDGDGRAITPRVRRWWHPVFGTSSAPRVPTEAFTTALRTSVRSHLVADVPVGILLSGGLDSTAVAMLAAKEGPMVTLSVGFSDADYDESRLAAETAALLGTRHQELQLAPRRAVEALDRVMRHLDEPLADAGCLPAWELYRWARKSVTVAVGGDGGDELLEGYPTFWALELSRQLGVLRQPAPRWALGALVARLPVSDGYYPFGYQARRFLEGMAAEPWYRLLAYVGCCGPGLLTTILRKEVLKQAGLEGTPEEIARRLYAPALPEDLRTEDARLDANDSAVWAHLRNYLAGQVLRKVDRMSMAHGLEVRAPMLGSPFAETCLGAPSSARRRWGRGKLPLREWLARSGFPRVARGRKQGFSIPVARWLREEFTEVADAVFRDPSSPLREWCIPEAVEGLWEDHRLHRRDARKELWALLTLGLWLRYHESSP
jgi:asparagine synthase (glutamine-hydrolysing)